MRRTPLCGDIGAKMDKAQGRGFEPRPMEVLGTREGLGSQWCNRLPSIPQEVGGERGCVVGICVFRLLHDRLTFESTLTEEQEDR